MTLKEVLQKRRIKQVELAKALRIDPCRVSLIVNEIIPTPEKFKKGIEEFLGISIGDLTSDQKTSNGESQNDKETASK